MKILIVFLTILSVIAFSSCGQQGKKASSEKQTVSKEQTSAINTLSQQEKNEGWELLFNGKDLSGWKKYSGGEVTGWTVKNGILNNSGVGSKHGGDIITKKQDYKDFEFYLEWKISPQSNSGVFYHAKGGAKGGISRSGIEYQLIDGKGWPSKIHDDQYSGALYAMYPPSEHAVKPVGEWNVTRIIVKGPHVEHWLNGKKLVDCEMWSKDWYERKAKSKWKDLPKWGEEREGGIGLQDHGGLTQFRNIKIRRL
jgi:hypothetical protein